MINKKISEKINDIGIIDIIQTYLPLNKKGMNYLGVCPFHNDKNPSLVVNEKKQIFKCFSCGISGNAISFVSKYKNISYYEAIAEIANTFGLKLDLSNYIKNNEITNENQKLFKLNSEYLDICNVYLYQNKYSYALDYLYNRNINDEDIKYFHIGYNPKTEESKIFEVLTNTNNFNFSREDLLKTSLITIDKNGNNYDFYSNRVIFPIYDENNKIVGFSGRSIDNFQQPKYLNSAENEIFNKHNILYNWNNLVNNKDIWNLYIVEGYIDVIALHKSGINNCVATMGVNLGEQQINLIKKNPNIRNLILGFDNDEPGLNAKLKTGMFASKYFNTFVVKLYPDEYKDFDEVYQKLGKQKVQEYANNIEHFSIFYIKDFIHKKRINNIADVEYFYNSLINFLNEYGNIEYFDKYVDLIHHYTNLSIDKIKIDLKSILKTKSLTTNFNNNRYHFIYPEKKLDNNYSIKLNDKSKLYFNKYKMLTDRLILACLFSAKANKIINQNYLYYPDKKPYLYYVNNILVNFYDDFKDQIDYIDKSNMNELLKYCENNGFDSIIPLNFIVEKIVKNELESNKYIYDFNKLMDQIYDSQVSYLSYELLTKNNELKKYDFKSNEYMNTRSQIKNIHNKISWLKENKK